MQVMKNSLLLHFSTCCLCISRFCANFLFSTGSIMTFSFPHSQDLITSSTTNVQLLRDQYPFHETTWRRCVVFQMSGGLEHDAYRHDLAYISPSVLVILVVVPVWGFQLGKIAVFRGIFHKWIHCWIQMTSKTGDFSSPARWRSG